MVQDRDQRRTLVKVIMDITEICSRREKIFA